MQAILFDILNANASDSPPRVFFVDPQAIDEVRRVICASRFVFFMDAEIEMLTPFFALALNILKQQPVAVVSCAGALQRDADGGAQI